MPPADPDLQGTVDLGARRVPLPLGDPIPLAAGEAPCSLTVERACPACGLHQPHTTAVVYESHDDDRVQAREVTFLAAFAAGCVGCGAPMPLSIALDVVTHRSGPVSLTAQRRCAGTSRP